MSPERLTPVDRAIIDEIAAKAAKDVTEKMTRQIVDEAAREAVAATLIQLGIDVKNPLVAQMEFAALREMRGLMSDKEFEADLMHLRKWRQTMESAQAKGVGAAVTMIISAIGAMIVLGFRQWFQSGSP